MRRRLAAVVAAAAVVVVALSGCSAGGGSGAKDDLKSPVAFWSFTGIGAKGAVADYLKKVPGAQVKLTEVGSSSETATALTAALAGGKVPDLVMIQDGDLPNFAANSANFLDLRTLGGKDVSKDYLGWAADGATAKNGSVIGIPTDVGGLSFAYRADLFAKAGLPTDPDAVEKMWSNWDDFIAMGKKYTAATGKPFVDNVETSVFYATVNQVTEQYYSPTGKLVLDSNPQVKDAFNVAVKAQQAGISANIAAFSSASAPGMANGAFAVTLAPSWMLSGIKTNAPKTSGQWRVATVPGIGGNWGGSVIAIPARAAHPAAAWQYIKTMMSPSAQEGNFNKTGSFPAATSAIESSSVASYTDKFYGDSKIGSVIAASVKKYPSFYNGPDGAAISTALSNALITMEQGKVKPDDAWKAALSSANTAVKG